MAFLRYGMRHLWTGLILLPVVLCLPWGVPGDHPEPGARPSPGWDTGLLPPKRQPALTETQHVRHSCGLESEKDISPPPPAALSSTPVPDALPPPPPHPHRYSRIRALHPPAFAPPRPVPCRLSAGRALA